MPRYFFDVRDGDRHTRDDEGLVLIDRESARREAIASLIDIARDEMPTGDRRSFVVRVREGSTHYMLAATLAVDADWIDEKVEFSEAGRRA